MSHYCSPSWGAQSCFVEVGHLTAGILSMPTREGGLAPAPLACYALWVHSHSFVTAVCHPHVYDASHVEKFQCWAGRVGMVLDEVTLPYIQLAPVNIKKTLFPIGDTKGVLTGAESPPPPATAVTPNGHLAYGIFEGGYGIDVCVSTISAKRCPAMAGFKGGGSGTWMSLHTHTKRRMARGSRMFAYNPWPRMTGHEDWLWTDGWRAGEDNAHYSTCS